MFTEVEKRAHELALIAVQASIETYKLNVKKIGRNAPKLEIYATYLTAYNDILEKMKCDLK